MSEPKIQDLPDNLPPDQVIDALLRLQANARDRFEKRRAVEWKLNFTVWTAMLLIAAGAASGEYSLPLAARISVSTCILALLCVYWHWARELTCHMENDSAHAQYFGKTAEKMIAPLRAVPYEGNTKYEPTPWQRAIRATLVRHRLNWGTATSLAITILLSVLCVVSLLCGGP